MIEIKYNGLQIQADGNTAKELWRAIINATMASKQEAKMAQPETKPVKRKVKHHTAQLWTQAEYDNLMERNNQLKAGGVKIRSKRVAILAKEFTDRTPVAILSRIAEAEKGIPFKMKPHWRKVNKFEPESEPATPQREYLTNNPPSGEIQI